MNYKMQGALKKNRKKIMIGRNTMDYFSFSIYILFFKQNKVKPLV